MMKSGGDRGGGRRHWLVALGIVLLMMIVVPLVARFY